jgi:hypothetical protein
MKFFNISALKSEIANGLLTQAQVFSYWIATTIVLCLAGAPFSYKSSPFLWVYWVLYSAINLFGVRKCYLANGGSKGSAFSDKLVSLGWVVSVRSTLMLLLPMFTGSILLLGIIGGISGMSEAGLQLYGELLSLMVLLIYLAWVWLKISSHIRQLR